MDETTSSLFSELSKLFQKGDYDKALRVTNTILHGKSSDDTKAVHCKVVCLIQLGKFEDGLTLIRKSPQVAGDVGFEKAYCEYRLNRNSEALKTLMSLENRTAAANELLAQVLYRMEDFVKCYDIYRDQLKNTSDDFHSERETNLSAVLAAMQIWGPANDNEFGLEEETYEVCYNHACFLIGNKRYRQACDKLKEAEAMCIEFFGEDPDSTEEDVEAELCVIRAQLGYAYQLMGKFEEATKLYNQVIKQRPSDIALLAVVSNNIVTLNKDQNVFDSKKKIKSATVNGLQNKLHSRQRETIAMNQCLLYMYSNQGDQCGERAALLQKTYPYNDTPTLISAAHYVKDKQFDKAIDVVKAQIARSNDEALRLRLSLAQLYLTSSQLSQACDVLKSLESERFKPAIVSALVALYTQQEDVDEASATLRQAVEWYTHNQSSSPHLVPIMKASVEFEMKHGEAQAAIELLETLRKKDASDLKILAQLISAYSKFAPKKAEEVSRQLPSPDDISNDVDSAAVEAAVTSYVPRYVKKSTAAKLSPSSPRSGAGDEPVKKHRKKKKGKLPKKYEVGSTPDPERWLPLRERSTYKGRRRRNKRDVGKGTQGSSAASAALMAQLDISKASGESQASAATAPAPPPKPHKPQGAKPKKKKKGGKW